MKKIIIAVFVFIFIANETVTSQVSVDVSFNTFYTELSPYGRWIDYPEYGRIWICNENGFRPYYDAGHWVYTEDGWTWVSDYSWGWAPFHYGRWAYLPAYGWVWIPGYEWAPAWVSWCDGDGYYGWAPLSPGLSIDISFSSIPADRWCFVPHQDIYATSLRSHFINEQRGRAVFRNVKFINNVKQTNNTRYIAGPKRGDVERVTHHTIQPRTISYSQRPGKSIVKDRSLNIYRPNNGVKKQHITNAPTNIHQPIKHQQKNRQPQVKQQRQIHQNLQHSNSNNAAVQHNHHHAAQPQQRQIKQQQQMHQNLQHNNSNNAAVPHNHQPIQHQQLEQPREHDQNINNRPGMNEPNGADHIDRNRK